ncbi:MAG: response regulator [Methylococcales bacterium]|nr:response regulator [Methylococcales bacterium]MBT7411255.1 response regulator [Methylococcales bacterium]
MNQQILLSLVSAKPSQKINSIIDGYTWLQSIEVEFLGDVCLLENPLMIVVEISSSNETQSLNWLQSQYDHDYCVNCIVGLVSSSPQQQMLYDHGIRQFIFVDDSELSIQSAMEAGIASAVQYSTLQYQANAFSKMQQMAVIRESLIYDLKKIINDSNNNEIEDTFTSDQFEDSSCHLNFENKNLLIIDDDDDVLVCYQDIFKQSDTSLENNAQPNYEISLASRGEIGCQLAMQALYQKLPFAVAFVDIKMTNGWGGLKTARRLRQLDKWLHIVIVSDNSDYDLSTFQNEIKTRLTVVSKPFNHDEILQIALNSCQEYERDQYEIKSHHAISNSLLDMQSAKELAESANRAKSEFLSMMSHEFRIPLTSILGMSELLSDTYLNENQHKMLKTLASAGKSLLTLVNDLLDLAKIESGKFEVLEEPFDLKETIDNVINLFNQSHVQKGVDFHYEFECNNSQYLLGDADRLKQVLVNLLGNAFKFTEEGFVQLNLKETSRDEQSLFVNISIKDSGIGMNEETQSRLFGAFEQADSSISKKYGGTGLGLAISKQIINSMFGDIIVNSEMGVGTEFVIRLKLPLTEMVIAEKPSVTSVVKGIIPHLYGQVLLADDTCAVQLLVKQLIEMTGAKVIAVSNGEEALEEIKNYHFDLIFLDMQMPKLDGIQTTKILRQTGCTIPIIALTANVMKSHRERFLAAGSNEFLSKPIDREKLNHVLSQYLPESTVKHEELGSVTDEQLEAELFQSFLKTLQKCLHDLDIACGQHDFESMQQVAHIIKGMGGSYNYDEISVLGQKLEKLIELKSSKECSKVVTELKRICRPIFEKKA